MIDKAREARLRERLAESGLQKRSAWWIEALRCITTIKMQKRLGIAKNQGILTEDQREFGGRGVGNSTDSTSGAEEGLRKNFRP